MPIDVTNNMTTDPIELTIVILRASGDLTQRLLFPALHRLLADHRLSPSAFTIGFH
jgi:glucose-6-phosphate 1-dehydrogenase